MSGHDPIELLRELGRAQRASFKSAADADQVLTELGARAPGRLRAWLRRRRRWVAGIIAVLVGAGGGTVAWAIVHRERATVPTTVDCFIEPRLDGPRFIEQADGSDPADLCAAEWPSVPEFGPVQSQLTACKGPDGRPAVFPGDEDVCATLGLPPLDPSLSEDDAAIIAFQEQLVNRIAPLGCLTPDELAELARQTAADVGLDGWTIIVEPPTAEQPCGRFVVDVPSRVISILPLPDMTGGNEGG